MIPKRQCECLQIQELEVGGYYAGYCRNATIARWDGKRFRYWRTKFGSTFLEYIEHPDNESLFDVFVAKMFINAREVKEIPIEGD